MERLNYKVLKESGYDGFILEKAPEKVTTKALTKALKRLWKNL